MEDLIAVEIEKLKAKDHEPVKDRLAHNQHNVAFREAYWQTPFTALKDNRDFKFLVERVLQTDQDGGEVIRDLNLFCQRYWTYLQDLNCVNTIKVVLGCHDRILETLAHTDILRCCPRLLQYFVVSTVPLPVHDNIVIESEGHQKGVILSVIAAIKEAHARGWKTIIYRNGDDWILNWSWVFNNWDRFHKGSYGPYKIGGYNWNSKDTMSDLAINELIIDVETFYEDIATWEHNIHTDPGPDKGETFMGVWARHRAGEHAFMRLEGREREGGIGHYHTGEGENSRDWNKEWGLVASHNDRRRYYNMVEFDYRAKLESMPYFKAWLGVG